MYKYIISAINIRRVFEGEGVVYTSVSNVTGSNLRYYNDNRLVAYYCNATNELVIY